ncbi:MAG: aldo/keto reductase [Novosphingobium sp.]|nr:aldo/keto reductase [Novosphingobium sp.]
MAPIAGLPGYPPVVLGTMGIAEEDTVGAIHAAIALGYRAFDTAPVYFNEAAVGEAVRTAPVPRDALFLTTKLWNSCHGHDEALAAFDRTMQRLGLDYVDLYLIHWPVPTVDRFVETWRALVRLRAEGRVKAIGVSNFLPEHLDRIIDATGVVPAVNQVEMHPAFPQAGLRAAHERLGIVTQAWSPLGHGTGLDDPALTGIAARHGKTPAQVILRWLTQRGVVPVVKSRSPARMAENLSAHGFDLSPEELARIDAMDRGNSLFGLDPRTFETMPRMAGLTP